MFTGLPPFHSFESDGVWLRFLTDQCILLVGQTGGLQRFLCDSGETEGGKDHAPPVFSCALTDEHPKGLIISGGKGDIFILPGGEPGFFQTDLYRVVIALGGDFLGGGLASASRLSCKMAAAWAADSWPESREAVCARILSRTCSLRVWSAWLSELARTWRRITFSAN